MTVILNLMLSRGRGGLEQAAVDYAEALAANGYAPLTVTHPQAWVKSKLAEKNLPFATLHNFGAWDIFAAWRLRRIAEKHGARAVICHGNRALTLALATLEGHIPVIAVAHNYQTRRFAGADICFAVTEHAASHLEADGISRAHIFTVPNMVHLPDSQPRGAYRMPPIVGSMGRFHKKKGFDIYLEALAQLAGRGIRFAAILGGDGEEAPTLRKLIAQHRLQDKIALPGWVDDKAAFFAGTDIFVLPSRQESFGLVLLEAMAYGVPVVAADANGPREIIHHGQDGLLVPRGNAAALAEAISTLLADENFARKLARNARALVEREYGLPALSDRLKAALDKILIPATL